MTAEQLEELLGMLDNGHALDHGRAMDELACLAPSIARRVIAAEKLVEALKTARDYVSDAHIGCLVYDDGRRVSEAMTTDDLTMIDAAIRAYQATK